MTDVCESARICRMQVLDVNHTNTKCLMQYFETLIDIEAVAEWIFKLS